MQHFKIKEVRIDRQGLKKYTNRVERNGAIVVLPAERTEIEMNKTIIYRTMNIANKKIESAPEEEMEKAKEGLREYIVFDTCKKYESFEVKSSNKEIAATNAMKLLTTERWVFIASALGKELSE